MNTTVIATLALASLLATGAIADTASAAADNEATALQGAKVSLTQAIATAEQQTGGRAYDAGVDTKGGRTHVVVETNGPKGVQTVSIDAQSGLVVGSHAGGEAD